MGNKKFFNFNSEEEFDLNQEYTSLFGEDGPKEYNANDNKIKDAEDIIADLGATYMEGSSIRDYEETFKSVNSFLTKFKTESDTVKAMTQVDRDKLYGYGRELFSFYQNSYNGLKFNFELSIKEWHYIEHTLTKKLSYDGKEVFNYWELYTTFIEPNKNMVAGIPKDQTSFVAVCTIQNLILLSHLLMQHSEKGSTLSFEHFRTILSETAKMTKLFNAYGVMLERLTNHFQNWINTLNAMDGFNNVKDESPVPQVDPDAPVVAIGSGDEEVEK